jgi:UrcA family protein
MRHFALATLTAAAALACGAPAMAQTIEELIVTGHINGAHARSLSEPVSYADLDLTYYGDRQRLLNRVNDAARRLCTQLNQESRNPANMGRSCQDYAVRDAMGQVRQAFAEANSPAYVDAYGAPASATAPDYYYAPPPAPPRYDPRYDPRTSPNPY